MNAPRPVGLITWIDRHDRAFLVSVATKPRSVGACAAWRVITHSGGAIATVLACLVPLMMGWYHIGLIVTSIVVVSHVAVQIVKRTVGRPRPAAGTDVLALAAEPDRFSFPSGHAAAAMAVALGYGFIAPASLPLLVAAAMVVGVSRVVLGVHYLGDVLAGQCLALLTALLVRAYAW